MDFNDTPEEAAFRAEVRAFLQAHAPRKDAIQDRYTKAYPSPEMVQRARAWQRVKADNGFAAILWPERWGGRAGRPIEQLIYNQEESRYDVPRGVYDITLGMCIPTLMAYAPDSVLEKRVPAGMRGEEIWCQLFSEPGAGSDLAGLRTRARKVGDKWVINGQKVWTSRADIADFGLLIARTDDTALKHAGLTAFYVDMRSRGVDVRPIRQVSGDFNFNEVFLDDVEIPDVQRLGAVGDGWAVSLTTLSHERVTVGEIVGPNFADLFRFCTAPLPDGTRPVDDPAVRQRLADFYMRTEGVRHIRARVMTAMSQGKRPGPEASVAKVVNATKLQEMATFALDLMGPAGPVMDRDRAPMSGWFQQAFVYSPGKRVGGGTDEILKNIIAERVLGLPGDMRADRVPFNKIPTGLAD